MAEPDKAESARVSAYLLTQAEKYTWLELWPRVVQGRLEFLDAIRGVGEEQADFRPAPGDWTIREVAQHVLTSSQAVAGLIAALVAGRPGPDVERADRARELASASLADLRRDLLRDSVAFSGIATRFPTTSRWSPPRRIPSSARCTAAPGSSSSASTTRITRAMSGPSSRRRGYPG